MRRAIEIQHRKYLEYDPNLWVGEFFDENSGGYVVTHLKRRANADINNDEARKYIKELDMTIVFAHNGYSIEMLEEKPDVRSYDVLIDGKPADLKRTKAAHNIHKYAKEAVMKQGAEIVLFQFEENTNPVRWKLLTLKQKGYKVLYFFTDEQKVYVL